MVDDAVAEEVSGYHDAGREHVRELQGGRPVGRVAHDIGATSERCAQAWGDEAVFMDGHHLGQVFPENVGPQDGPPVGGGTQFG